MAANKIVVSTIGVVAVIAIAALFGTGCGGGGGGNSGSAGGGANPQAFILETAPFVIVQNVAAILNSESLEEIPQQLTRFIAFNMPRSNYENAEAWKDEWRDTFSDGMPGWLGNSIELDQVTYVVSQGVSGTYGQGQVGLVIAGDFDFDDIREELDNSGLKDSEYRDFETWDDLNIALLEDRGIIVFSNIVQPFLKALATGEGFVDDDSPLKQALDKEGKALVIHGDANCALSLFFSISSRGCEALVEAVEGGDAYTSNISGVYVFRRESNAENALEDIEDTIEDQERWDADIENIERDGELVTYKVTIHEEDVSPAAEPMPSPIEAPALAATTAILETAPFVIVQNVAAILNSESLEEIPQQLTRFIAFNMPRSNYENAEAWKDEWRDTFSDGMPGWLGNSIELDQVTYVVSQGVSGTYGQGQVGLVIAGDFDFDDIREELDNSGLKDSEYRDFETWDDLNIALLEDRGIIVFSNIVQPFLKALATGEGFVDDDSPLKQALDKEGKALVIHGDANCALSLFFSISSRGCEALVEAVEGGDAYTSNISGVYVFRRESSAENALENIEDTIEDQERWDADIENIERDGELVTYKVTIHEEAVSSEAPAPAATAAAPAMPQATAAPAATTAPRAIRATATPAAVPATAVPRATAAPTTAPPAGAMFKTDRVRFALPTPDVESNRTWAGSWPYYIVQHDVFAETLLRVDENTSEVGPLLAESWEWSNDFRTWSFKLRKGIPFQFGWGDFSSADVLHSFDLVNREDSLATMKASAWSQATVEIIDDYNIKFHFENPYLDGTRLFSRHAGDLIIVSDAQFQAEGMDAFDNIQTAGTGPYQLTARELGVGLTYERVPEGHWLYDVDFDNFEFIWARESLTRLAMLLAWEVHLSQIERTVQPDAEARGMKVINSANEAAQTYIMFGGLYRENTPEWPDHFTPGLPLQNANIRKALNKAIDREAINQEIYLGRATNSYNYGFHPNNEGWNPEWVERWDEMYGYDRDEAIALLAAEGYGPDNHLKLKFISTTIPGSPEFHDVIEAIQIMYDDVNVDLEIEKLDFGTWLQRGRDHKLENTLRASRNFPIRSTQEGIRVFFTNHYASWYLNEPFVNDTYLCLERSTDLEERDNCARDIGNYIYDNHMVAPMFHLYADVTVNSDFIESYVWPGLTSAGVSHFHNIKGVTQ